MRNAAYSLLFRTLKMKKRVNSIIHQPQAVKLGSNSVTHPSVAVLRQRARTVPAAGSVEMHSMTMEPSAHKIWAPGFTSTARLL